MELVSSLEENTNRIPDLINRSYESHLKYLDFFQLGKFLTGGMIELCKIMYSIENLNVDS